MTRAVQGMHSPSHSSLGGPRGLDPARGEVESLESWSSVNPRVGAVDEGLERLHITLPPSPVLPMYHFASLVLRRSIATLLGLAGLPWVTVYPPSPG